MYIIGNCAIKHILGILEYAKKLFCIFMYIFF
ncbi:hypothetical protein MFI2_0447 [Mycoplasmopsis fermentans MF-I2]|nr:hypothetical protein MFI2_0447 [Mycoplasmopsis fermentans MF-I2]RMX35409.1 hypothetical protein MFI1_0460 [Mycoplasmopsis fermentans MF-I1]